MPPETVEKEAFREAMGLLPTGVTIVTAFGEASPSGATANAVCSLSLEPMLMLACLDRGSHTLRSVQSAFVAGMDAMLWVCGGIAVVGLVLALRFLPRRAAAADPLGGAAESVHAA